MSAVEWATLGAVAGSVVLNAVTTWQLRKRSALLREWQERYREEWTT
jgi:hypothetical protein